MNTRTFLVSVTAAIVLCSTLGIAGEKADRVVVEKTTSKLHLMRDGEVFASFRVAFGKNPKGHKERQGDGRTPEGKYTLDYKNPNSSYYKSIHISYPNSADRQHARKLGVDPGGDIMIHGQPNGKEFFTAITQLFNWTNGCIALSNADMDRVWEAVDIPTPIEIKP
jgi:murein L,D-transpeptidase YafK